MIQYAEEKNDAGTGHVTEDEEKALPGGDLDVRGSRDASEALNIRAYAAERML